MQGNPDNAGFLQGFSLEDPCKKSLAADGRNPKDTFLLFRSDSHLCFNKIIFVLFRHKPLTLN